MLQQHVRAGEEARAAEMRCLDFEPEEPVASAQDEVDFAAGLAAPEVLLILW